MSRKKQAPQQDALPNTRSTASVAPTSVTVLGLTFDSDDARRVHFRDELRAKLRDPAFRAQPGFPLGDDEAIVAMSDPPWHTACPNPWLDALVRAQPSPSDASDPPRDAFALDAVEKKTGALYQAHGYHTKVPFQAILPMVLHYTKPGDVILDGFCGSGMAGVAAQWCGTDDAKLRAAVTKRFKDEGFDPPAWGARRAVLNDLSPAATFIAANYNTPFDTDAYEVAARALLAEVDAEIGWMYRTQHSDGRVGRIEYTVWSEVFQCPHCNGEVVFTEEALDEQTMRVRESFPCPNKGCAAPLNKDILQRVMVTEFDSALDGDVRHHKLVPHSIWYALGDEEFEKKSDADDLAILEQVRKLPLPKGIPTIRFPIEKMSHGSRLKPKGYTHVHQMFLPRARHAIALLWQKAQAYPDERIRHMLLFTVEQAVWGMSVLARYVPTHYSQVNQYLTGVYYIPSQTAEVSFEYILGDKVRRLGAAFREAPTVRGAVSVTTGTCAALPLSDASIDYIFTDPPFGENIYYADLNFLVESFHGVVTDAAPEAIVDRAKHKDLFAYQSLMTEAFREYHRVLKPGRWITVEFHNQHNHVWHAIQEAMTAAGFVIAAVRTFDKTQRSYRQVTSATVQLDLLVTAYRPAEMLDVERRIRQADPDAVWPLIEEYLTRVPRGQRRADGTLEVVEERTAHKLFNVMVAEYVGRGESVPMSLGQFREALAQRYKFVDEMYFLPAQVQEYERIKLKAGGGAQGVLAPVDEATTIEWLRRELSARPRPEPELTPLFMRVNTGWRRHEDRVELRDVLGENFLEYTSGSVPTSLRTWLTKSSLLRELAKDADLDAPPAALEERLRGLWCVPDPAREAEMNALRQQRLQKVFLGYLDGTKKIRQFRSEALRVGFEGAWREKQFGVIVDLAARIPDDVLGEDPRLVKLVTMARTKVGKA